MVKSKQHVSSVRKLRVEKWRGGTALEDARIVELYWERDEAAIAESSAKYGGHCYQIGLSPPGPPGAGGDGDSRRRDHGCSDRYRTRKTGTSLPAGRRRSCDAPDVLRRKSGRYLPAGCQSGRKSGGSPGTPFGDRFQLSANVAFDRIVGRNAGHDLCDQTRPDRRRPPLPANGDRRKPQMHPIDLFILCRCSDFND